MPHIFEANVHNRRYLLTKAQRSGHMLEVDGADGGSANGVRYGHR